MKIGALVVSIALLSVTQSGFSATGGSFKRFSVSAGWLHAMPQGKANPFNISTPIANGRNANIGSVSLNAVVNSIDPSDVNADTMKSILNMLGDMYKENPNEPELSQFFELKNVNGTDEVYLKDALSGSADLYGLEQWTAGGSGLEVQDADTLGLMMNYYVNDNVSLQLIGGIPPKVDIKGKGEILAPMSGIGHTGIGLDLPLAQVAQDIPITNLGSKSKVATVRAWTPAFEAQYQFGQSGINKFRPYVGLGIMYAHFGSIKVNGETKADLVAAGHMIQNILDGKAGAALDREQSSASPYVKVKSEDAFAPIVSLGATYDITSNWYGVASVSYSKLNNKTTIDVIDRNTGNRLIHSSTKIDIDPLITYLGVGYRF